MHVCVSEWHVCADARGRQKRALDLLELELVVVSCAMGAGNGTWVLWKCSKSSQRLSHLTNPRSTSCYQERQKGARFVLLTFISQTPFHITF